VNLERIGLFYHDFHALLVFFRVFFGPPIMQYAVKVELSSLVIKPVLHG
jgi:hypothetical protein